MLHSDKFQRITTEIDGKFCEIDYVFSSVSETSGMGFGNLYLNPEVEPLEFTFFTINNQIAGYTPMNLKREVIASIVENITGKPMGFSPLLA